MQDAAPMGCTADTQSARHPARRRRSQQARGSTIASGGLSADAQAILAGNEEFRPTRQRRGEHPGVIRIAKWETGGGRRSSDDGVDPELVLNESDLGGWHLEPFAQDPAELCEIDFPGQQPVFGDDQFFHAVR